MADKIYDRMYNEILSKINSGQWRSGDKLPPERQLIKMYNTSDSTVRKALSMLSDAGYIIKRHGSGNYIADKVKISGLDADPDMLLVIPAALGVNIGLCELNAALAEAVPGVKIKSFAIDSNVVGSEQVRRLTSMYHKPMIVLNRWSQVNEMAGEGLLYPLEEFSGMAERLARMPENQKWLFTGLNGDSRYYGIPYLYSTTCMALNVELAQQAGLDVANPPRLWRDFLQWGRKFTAWCKQTGHTNLFAFPGYHRNLVSTTFISCFLMATEGMPWRRDESIRTGVKMTFDLIETALADGLINSVAIQAPDPFVSGKYLFSIHAGSWLHRDLRNFCPDMAYRLLPLPVPGENRPLFSSSGTQLWSLVMPDAASAGYAEALLEALFDPRLNCTLAWRFGCLPSDPVLTRDFVAAHPEFKPHYEALFACLEDPCPLYKIMLAKLDEIVKRRLDNPELRLDDAMVEEYVDYVGKLNPAGYAIV